MNRLLFFAALGLLSLNTYAANWHFLGSASKVKTYINPSSINGYDDIRELDYREEYSTPQKMPTSDKIYYAVKGHEIVNCKEHAYKIISVSYYGKDHRLLNKISAPKAAVPFVRAPFRSFAENDLEFACKHIPI